MINCLSSGELRHPFRQQNLCGLRLAYLCTCSLNLSSKLRRCFSLKIFKAYYPPSFLGGPWPQAIPSEHSQVLPSSHPLRFWRLARSSGPFQILPAPGETIIFVSHPYYTLASKFHALMSTVMQSLNVLDISGPYTLPDHFNPNFSNRLNLLYLQLANIIMSQHLFLTIW